VQYLHGPLVPLERDPGISGGTMPAAGVLSPENTALEMAWRSNDSEIAWSKSLLLVGASVYRLEMVVDAPTSWMM